MTDYVSTTLGTMAKKPRTRVVPVRFTSEEHLRIARAADRINASMSDYLRAAALIYTEIRRRPIFRDVLGDLVRSGAVRRLDLARETE